MRWIAATLMALLGVAYVLVALASPSTEVRPAPDETGHGGLSNLLEVLRSGGYRVSFDPSTRPNLLSSDVVVAPVLDSAKIPGPLLRHVRAGGRAVVLGIPSELQPISEGMEANDSMGRSAVVDRTVPAPAQPVLPEGVLATATDWSVEGTTLSSLQQVGHGRLGRFDAGALATNRFLARHNNVRAVLATVASVAHKGDRLVFVAEGYGEASAPGPIEALGPGAVGSLWQSLIVLAAFGLAKGVRFGLPVPERTEGRGSRELLDAVAGFYCRSKYAKAAVALGAKQHSEDALIRAVADQPQISEEEARKALLNLEARSGKVHRDG